MALSGKICVVTGGSGTIGGGIAARYLREGATVIAPLRGEASRAQLLKNIGDAPQAKLLSPVIDYATTEGCAKLASFVTNSGFARVHNVVAISGGMLPAGRASEVATPDNVAALANVKLGPQLYMQKHLFPLLEDAPTSSYLVITGGLGLPAVAKMMPLLSLTAMANAALFNFVIALRAEKGETLTHGPRIIEVRLQAMVSSSAYSACRTLRHPSLSHTQPRAPFNIYVRKRIY